MEITYIVSVGSVDGVCTTAALIRLIGSGNVGLQFTQAFMVDKIDVAKWPAGQKVAFVDLAVCNRDKAVTADFVRRVREAGHQIVAVVDEHSREDWLDVLGTFEGLEIEPQSQHAGTFKSSGAVLKAAVGSKADAHAIELLDAADAGDRRDFSTRLGGIVNQAVKSDIGNDARRVYLARHFAQDSMPDQMIQGWMGEYEQILVNHRKIAAARAYIGGGFVRIVTTGMNVDMTTIMSGFYEEGDIIGVVTEFKRHDEVEDRDRRMVSIDIRDKSIDLLALVKAAVPEAYGFANKVNVDLCYEEAAINVIRRLLEAEKCS